VAGKQQASMEPIQRKSNVVRLPTPVPITEQVWPEGTAPIVSVFCITYNHENFIRDAIEGFLMQETTFPVEIFIHDDASTDRTADIVREYAEKYPHIFWTVLQKENQWSRNTGCIFEFLRKQRGNFLAFCEGDDFWTKTYKLEKQVRFLEENPDYSICFHRVQVLSNTGNLVGDPLEARFEKIQTSYSTRFDLIKHGNFINTASAMYRNDELNYPPELSRSPVGDYLLHICRSEQGHIHRLDESMAVYRSGVGIYSTLDYSAMRWQMIKYNVCLLSFLNDERERLMVLDRCLSYLHELSETQNVPSQTRYRSLVKRLKQYLLARQT
jgi:glycosyltransferase involved in cell wall biosynthesis